MLKKIWLKGFRNLKETVIDFNNQKLIYIFGENNQGKTNLLEAIYFLGNINSPKNISINNLINFKEQESFIGGDFFYQNQNLRVYTKLTSNNNKFLIINNKPVKKIEILKNNILIENISPENLRLFLDNPEYRRLSLDSFIKNDINEYTKIIKDYQKIIKQKNFLLKEKSKKERIELWNEKLILSATNIINYRLQYLKKIETTINIFFKRFNKLKDKKLIINYQFKNFAEQIDNNNYQEKLAIELDNNFHHEQMLGISLYGPHRDDFSILIDNKEINLFFSRGINLLFSLLYRLSQLIILQETKQIFPILLLDDIFSELDNEIIKELLDIIAPKTQIFYATIQDTTDQFFKEAKKIKIVNGEIFHV